MKCKTGLDGISFHFSKDLIGQYSYFYTINESSLISLIS